MVRRRIATLIVILGALYAVLTVRLAALQLDGERHAEFLRRSQHLAISYPAPRRGRILSQDGHVLSVNQPTFELHVFHRDLSPRERLLDSLFRVFRGDIGFDRQTLEARMRQLAEIDPITNSQFADARGHSQPTQWIPFLTRIDRPIAERLRKRLKRQRRAVRRAFLLRPMEEGGRRHELCFSPTVLFNEEFALMRVARVVAARGSESVTQIYERLVDSVGRIAPGLRLQWRPLLRDVSLDVVTAIEYSPTDFRGLKCVHADRRFYPEREICGSFLGHLRRPEAELIEELRAQGLTVERARFDGTFDTEEFIALRPYLRSEKDLVGALGLEAFYEDQLRGRYGARVRQVDSVGRTVRVIAEVEPEDGVDLYCTVDLELQRFLHRELESVLRGQSGGAAASAVVMDLSTGALLAYVGLPSFDPNRMLGREYASYLEEMTRRWGGRTDGWFLDRPSRHAMDPGSVFKLVLAAAALESAAETGYSPTDLLRCEHRYEPYGLRCVSTTGHGLDGLDLSTALKVSCNTYFYELGLQRLTAERFHPWAERLGYGCPVGIDLVPLDQSGFLKPADAVEGIQVCRYSIGQVHVRATALQVLSSVATIATDGRRIQPHLVAPRPHPGSTDGCAVSFDRSGSVFNDASTAMYLRRAMWRVTHDRRGAPGTAAKEHHGLLGLRVAAKSGTAERAARPGAGETNDAWLAGFAPASASGELIDAPPRIAFVVVVEGTGGHGADVCAPIVSRMIKKRFASVDPDAYFLSGAER